MRRALLLGLVAAVAGGAQLAEAGVVERIRIADSVRASRGLPPGLVVELASPDEYNRATFSGMGGSWVGPRYQSKTDPAVAGSTSIVWRLSFDDFATDKPEQVVVRHLRNPTWRRDQRGGLSIVRVVGRRVIGTILGDYYLLNPAGGDARFEAVLAFPLEKDLHAVLELDLSEPATDEFFVKQSIDASNWNRGQALIAMSKVRLRGNMAPKVVAARRAERGRIVRGKVVDRFLHPVVGAPVALERMVGGRSIRVARGKTSGRGFYRLRAGRPGTYRVTVNMAGFKAESRPVRAGRRAR
jgi:hypothetical protein